MLKKWTDDEMKILQDTHKTIPELHMLLPHRSPESIRIKAGKLGHLRTGDALLRNSSNYLDLLENSQFKEVVDGELLGDGCITKGSRGYSTFALTCGNKGYAEYLHSVMAPLLNSKSKVHYRTTKPHSINGKYISPRPQYCLRYAHKVFDHFYDRWYSPKKCIPSDIELTSGVCLHWYLGDGSITSNRTLQARLSTDSFTEKEVERLASQLKQKTLAPKIANERDGIYIVHFFGKHALDLLDYIGPCPVESLNYRWNTSGYSIYNKTCRCGRKFKSSGFVESWKKYCSSECQQKFKRRKN